MLVEDIVGAWRLDRFFSESPDRRRRYPYGEDAKGLLLYSADGWVSAVLHRGDRAGFASESMERAGHASEADKVRAFDGYTSYAGRYSVDGDVVRHEVAHALVPTLVGQTLERQVRLHDGALSLSYEVGGRTQTYVYVLHWSRA